MPVLQLLYKSDFYELEADEREGLIRAKWIRPVTCNEMITGGTKLYDVLQDTKFKKVLANGQALMKLDAETKDWMSNTFYQLLSQTELQKIARVLPNNVFYHVALESVATRAEASGVVKFQFKNFKSEKDALFWLNS
jgi:hydroxyethylthiazole kinase-like sugar kinase family protein